MHMNDAHYDQRARTITSEIGVREDQLKELKQEEDTIKTQLDEQTKLENQAREELIQVQSRIAAITASVDRSNGEIMELLNNRASTKAKIQKYDTMLEQIQVRKSGMARQLLEAAEEIRGQTEKYEEYQEELKEVSGRIIELSEENSRYEEKIAALQARLTKQTEQFRIGQTAYHREESRLESLKNITERYDGYEIGRASCRERV